MAETTEENPLEKGTAFMKEAGATPAPGRKILVVDDELPLLKLLEFLLSRQGYTVISATNGDEALALLRREHPDLVVLDVMMPRRDGYSVAAAVRAEPEIAATPIIMLTAKAQEEDRERGFAVGVSAYVTKPFDPDHLSSLIAGYLDKADTGVGL